MVLTRFSRTPSERLAAWCGSRGVKVVAPAGRGQQGEVYLTDGGSVVKVLFHRELYARESAAYQRLGAAGVTSVCGHRVPVLLAKSDVLGVLALSYVHRPFVLDFASAALEKPTFVHDGPELWPGPSDFTAEQIDRVKEIRNQLWDRAGVWIDDLHPGNVGFA